MGARDEAEDEPDRHGDPVHWLDLGRPINYVAGMLPEGLRHTFGLGEDSEQQVKVEFVDDDEETD